MSNPHYVDSAIAAVATKEALALSETQQNNLRVLKAKSELPEYIDHDTMQLLLVGMDPSHYQSFVDLIHEKNPNFWSAYLVSEMPAKLYDDLKATGKLDSFIDVFKTKLKADSDFSLDYLRKLGERFRSADDVTQVYTVLEKPRVQKPVNPAQNNQSKLISRKKFPVFIGFTLDELNDQAREDYARSYPKKGRLASAWESAVRFFVPESLANRWFLGNAALAEKLRGYKLPEREIVEQPAADAAAATVGEVRQKKCSFTCCRSFSSFFSCSK